MGGFEWVDKDGESVVVVGAVIVEGDVGTEGDNRLRVARV